MTDCPCEIEGEHKWVEKTLLGHRFHECWKCGKARGLYETIELTPTPRWVSEAITDLSREIDRLYWMVWKFCGIAIVLGISIVLAIMGWIK